MWTCDVDGCDKPHRARGLCATHYNQAHQPNRHPKVEQACHVCDAVTVKHHASGQRRTTCSETCRRTLITGRPAKPKPLAQPKMPVDKRGAMRRAVEDGDQPGVIAAIRASVQVSSELGCWNWQRQLKDGYAVALIGKRYVAVHRLALEAALGKPLGKQAAHHKCANAACVNPDHLQPVTARENMAEMLARTYLESRIRDLEAALALTQPEHPLLREVGISRVA